MGQQEGYAYTLFIVATDDDNWLLLFVPGEWLSHPLLIFSGKIVVDTIPGMRQELSWTLVNLLYLSVRLSSFSFIFTLRPESM